MNRLVSPLLAGLVLATAGLASPSAAAEPSSNPTDQPAASPLEGKWQTTFTCQDAVDVLARTGWESEAPANIQNDTGAATPPPANDPCVGAPANFTAILAFAGPELVAFDPGGLIGMDTSVSIEDMPVEVGGATGARPVDYNGLFIIPGDPGDPDYPMWYVIAGDTLTVRSIIRAPGWIARMEVADWHRVE